MALRGFGAEIAGKSFYCIFPVRLGDSASPVMQRDIDKIIDHLKLSFHAECRLTLHIAPFKNVYGLKYFRISYTLFKNIYKGQN